MEDQQFSPESERYMIDHMNTEHADSNLLYVKVYGKLWQATAAQIQALDKEGMDMLVTVPGGTTRVRIVFEHRLEDARDAERTLVAMSHHAAAVLAQQAPQTPGHG